MQLNEINYKRSYALNTQYEKIVNNINSIEKLKRYVGEYPKPICFDKNHQEVTFISERLIPNLSNDCPSIMLLFSNPHPHSIEQGMFLSPNTNNVSNPFWSFMEKSGWFSVNNAKPTPEERCQIFLKREYKSEFNFIFHCYYDFPTNDPKEIKKIFGKDFTKSIIEPEAKNNIKEIIAKNNIKAILVLNKEVYNFVADVKIGTYINMLNEGELIKGNTEKLGANIPIYLSYPTGWHYHKNIKQLRHNSLCKIKEDILKKQLPI